LKLKAFKIFECYEVRGISGLSFMDMGPLTKERIVGFMDVFNRGT
jgi:hypothetical protein